MKQTILRAFGLVVVMTVLCGLLYTLVCTGVAQALFPRQAGGSVIEVNGKTYGSELLAQQFTQPGHLWGRPMNLDFSSFTDDEGNPVMYAWATNKSPAGRDMDAMVQERMDNLIAADPAMEGTPIPVDLVTVSGSGLDPEISPEAAEYQVHRIAQARELTEDEVRQVIERYTTGRWLGVFGEPRVNVLKVNLALDGILEE
ncbi:potassium-transporting ATPase subunit KdpC [Oscillibacter sp. MSJ-2]|uniref:Potassium-transporting ATPase KdpC subunit n=1 Tax=Dysosmobacter acutus TaxID=2841504 RepID=A0ABS6F5C2_9FIRM|nr:potassium-transporting ATPase subunit KdpC [Dysosmobacter acutus]MBU5625470.1 potassium-transporting ATPase subunit KdpC [Dysosmobacter acutus]